MKHRNMQGRLERRIDDFAKIKTNTTGAFHRPGSIKKTAAEGWTERNRRRSAAGIRTNLPSHSR